MCVAVQLLAAEGISIPDYTLGENSATLCPRCSHTRSKSDAACLSVLVKSPTEVVWRCHHCGWKGGAGSDVELAQMSVRGSRTARIRELQGRPAPSAIPPLPAPKVYRDPPPMATRPLSAESVAFFAGRGITSAVTAAFRVCEMLRGMPQCDGPTLAVVFPYFRNGALVNRKYRAVREKSFVQDRGTRRTLFNVDAAAGFHDVVLVEGEMDVLALAEAGVPCAASLPDGAGKAGNAKRVQALRESGLLTNGRRIYLAGDMDAPGRALKDAVREAAKEVDAFAIDVPWPAGCKDANDVLMAEGPAAVRSLVHAKMKGPPRAV